MVYDNFSKSIILKAEELINNLIPKIWQGSCALRSKDIFPVFFVDEIIILVCSFNLTRVNTKMPSRNLASITNWSRDLQSPNNPF